MNEITVLKVAPMCAPEVVTIKNDLRSLQEAVSIDAPYVGLIEIVNIDTKACITPLIEMVMSFDLPRFSMR